MNFTANLPLPKDAFEQTFEALPHMALVVTRDGTLFAGNARARRRFADAWVHGSSLSSFFEGDDAALSADVSGAASNGILTLRLVPAKGGEDRRLSFHVTPLAPSDRRPELFLLLHDPQQNLRRGYAELKLQSLDAAAVAAEMQERHEALRRGHEELRRFSQVAAHDLIAPLRSISTMLGMLEEDHGHLLPADALEDMAIARNSAVRLQHLIDDLLEHATTGMRDLRLSDIAVQDTLMAVQEDLRAELRVTGAQVVVVGDLGRIDADAGLFHRLLDNLLGNAVKYASPERHPVIRLTRGRLPDGKDALSVSDNGIGFDAAQVDKLFQPFQRLHRYSDIPGTGIGLSICRTICERHGWNLTAEGRPGEGATFTIAGMA